MEADNHCYICNNSIDYEKENSFYQIHTPTSFTLTLVSEYISRFLENRDDVHFSDTDVVCLVCMVKLNKYDKACKTADRIENELKQALYLAEKVSYDSEYLEYIDIYEGESDSDDKFKPEFEDTDEDDNTHEEYKMLLDIEEADPQNWDEHALEVEQSKTEENYSCNMRRSETKEIKYGFLYKHENQTSKQTKKRTRMKANEIIKCEHCSETFTTKTLFKNHTSTFHNPKKCGVCQKDFSNPLQLRQHRRTAHELQYSYECGYCGSNFKTEELLTKHISVHDTVKPAAEYEGTIYRCSFCGEIEATENELTLHVDKHEGQLKCVICGTIVKHKANLILHMRIHTGAKFFKCDKCDKEFVHKSSLRMHFQTTHSEVRQKQCPNCPLNFKTTSQLNQHLVTHSGVKKHQCPECSKSFAQRYNMMAHYRLHIGIGKSRSRNHRCSLCEDSFSSLSSLKIHVKKVHGLETESTSNLDDYILS